MAETDLIRQRAVGDRGAALVEFALVMPVLVLILFGIVEFGMAMNDFQSVRQAVRDGARQGVVADYGSTTSCGLNGAAASASGTPQTNAQELMCTTKARGGLGNDLRVRVVYTTGSDPTDYGKVKVCATRQAQSLTGLMRPFLSQVNLRSSIEMRAEKDLSSSGKAANQLASLSENDPSGANWSWC